MLAGFTLIVDSFSFSAFIFGSLSAIAVVSLALTAGIFSIAADTVVG